MTEPKQLRGWWARLAINLKNKLTNQGIAWADLKDSPSRPRTRRANFVRRNRELLQAHGDTMPRRVRRRIAWDSLNLPPKG